MFSGLLHARKKAVTRDWLVSAGDSFVFFSRKAGNWQIESDTQRAMAEEDLSTFVVAVGSGFRFFERLYCGGLAVWPCGGGGGGGGIGPG